MTGTRAPSRLLPAPAPPHDPYALLLAGHIGPGGEVGWRVRRTTRVDIEPTTRALVLAPGAASARWLTEPGGSFGGLRPRSNVAVTPAGDVLLLDLPTGELRRFDPCDCRFRRVPCVTRVLAVPEECERPASPPRFVPHGDLRDPQGLATCAGDLFLADRGHHRVLRYALGTWVPRGFIRVPPRARDGLAGGLWHPTGLAADGHGRLVVSDPVNGRLDRFDVRGRWIDTIPVAIGVTALAVDCRDRIHAIVEQDLQQAVPVSGGVRTIEIDAGQDGFHWHTLQLSAVSPAARFTVDVHAGDAPWTAAERNDPANAQWVRWLNASAIRSATAPLPLTGVLGRYLRVRIAHEAGTVQDAFDALAHGARVVRIDGTTVTPLPLARLDRVEGFGRPPLVVDAEGRLHLHCDAGIRVFDTRGTQAEVDQRTGARFEREGTYLSAALDSGIDDCLWNRIELRGAIPSGCTVEIRTTTAPIELTAGELDTLPAGAWSTATLATATEPRKKALPHDCAWDCLITSLPGRYLWMKLVLRGDGRRTPCLSSVLVEYPRVSLRRYLPSVFSVDPAGAEFTDRFTAVFDRTLRSIEGQLDTLALLFDPMSAPADAAGGGVDFLSWLGDWIGVTLSRDWPVERRRWFLKNIARLYAHRGTPDGFRQQLLLLLGFDTAYGERCLAVRPQRHCGPARLNCAPAPACTPACAPPLILEHFKLRRWLYAGHGRLGTDSLLWGTRIVNRSALSGNGRPPSGNAQVDVTTLNTVPDPLRDPFHVYAHKFSVFVPARVRDHSGERRALEQLVARETPAHTVADIRYVEPRFRVGVQATIGLDAVIARTPQGVRLEDAALGQGTVLTGRPGGPHLEVGNTRVGTTTRFT